MDFLFLPIIKHFLHYLPLSHKFLISDQRTCKIVHILWNDTCFVKSKFRIFPSIEHFSFVMSIEYKIEYQLSTCLLEIFILVRMLMVNINFHSFNFKYRSLKSFVNIRFILLHLESVGERDNENGKEEITPKANYNGDCSSYVRYWILIAISN